ncbi:S8 family serine peptidase, partial [Candidatus Roizmanbacteria bacterium]|nr:S8 family serine peptidase [Candidatus Roizmanbacteria bacterium]
MLGDSPCFNVLAPKSSSYSRDERRIVQHTYHRLAGTSMSAPHVSAVAALIKSYKPKLSNKAIMKSIVYSAKDAGVPGPDSLYGYGILDAAAALKINPGSFPPVEFTQLKRGFKERSYAPSQNSLFNKSIVFPGNRGGPDDPPASYITIPGNGSIKVSTPQTIEGWFKYNGDTNEGPPLQTLMRKTDQYGGHHKRNVFPYWVYLNSQKQFVYGSGENDIGQYQESILFHLTSKFFLQKNNWYHFAITFNGSISRVFLNGQLMDEIRTKYPIDDGSPLAIGFLPNVGFPFLGEVDELRISNIIRYKEEFTPLKKPFKNDSSTLGLWHFDDDTK